MASRRSRLRRNATRERGAQRDIFAITNEVAARTYLQNLLAIEDRRMWTPREETPRGFFRRSTKQVVQPYKARRLRNDVPAQVRFAVPREVAVCVRRKQRRSVLFALRKTGKGSRSRRKRNAFSEFRC